MGKLTHWQLFKRLVGYKIGFKFYLWCVEMTEDQCSELIYRETKLYKELNKLPL